MTTLQVSDPWQLISDVCKEPDLYKRASDTIKRARPAQVSKAEWDRQYEAWLRREPVPVGLSFDLTRSDLAAGPECRTVDEYYSARDAWKHTKPSGNVEPEQEECFL